MAGKSSVTASDEQRAALLALAGSRDRGEADRARAVLLTLAGWTSPEIAEAFGVREDTVRLWRSDFTAGGVAALKASIAPGPPPVKSEAALRVAIALAGRTCGRPAQLDDPPPARRDRSARGRAHQPFATVQGLAKKVPLAATPAHAEGASDRKARWNGWACACNCANSRPKPCDIVLLLRR